MFKFRSGNYGLKNDCMCKWKELLGDEFEHFQSLDSFEKASFVLGSEMWEDDFSPMLTLLSAWSAQYRTVENFRGRKRSD